MIEKYNCQIKDFYSSTLDKTTYKDKFVIMERKKKTLKIKHLFVLLLKKEDYVVLCNGKDGLICHNPN